MLVRFLLTVIIIYILYRLVKGAVLLLFPKERISTKAYREQPAPPRIGEELVEDPWCHTYVPITNALPSREGDRVVYFCSKECLENYKRHGGNS